MSELRIPVRVKAAVDGDEWSVDDLWAIMDEDGNLREDFAPHTIVVDSDHALYVEFGTGPAQKGRRASGKNVYASIYEWVEGKLGIKDPAKRRQAAHNIYHSIMENGIPPQPFLRPALQNVLVRIGNDYFSDGGTIRGLAEMIASEMVRLLQDHNTVYMGELRDSIRVVAGSVEEDDEQSRIPKEVWNRDDVGYDGKRKARYYR